MPPDLASTKRKGPPGFGGPFREPEGSCLCEKEKLGPSEWPQSDRDRCLLLLLRSCFLLGWGFLLRLRSALLCLLHWHVCLLAEIGCVFRTPLITGTFLISHPPPIR